MCLKETVCRHESRSRLEAEIAGWCTERTVWVLRQHGQVAAMMVLKEVSGVWMINYIVVAQEYRLPGRRLGRNLVEHAKSLHPYWMAEARNVRAERMLSGCGFRRKCVELSHALETSHCGYPIFEWSRPELAAAGR